MSEYQWKTVSVVGFDELMQALERAERKGYMSDAIKEEWEAFNWTPEQPAQRPWVGLTDEAIWLEYQRFWPFHPAEEPTLAKDIAQFANAIEAKLKEKNQ